MRPDTLSRSSAGRLKRPRQVKLVATAMVIISLSAAGLFAVSLFPNALSALSGIVTDHPGYIRATNAIVAGICAVFLLWPRAGSRLVGRWNEYVGWAFFILFIQYVIRLAALFAAVYVQPEWDSEIKTAADLLIYPASFLNNILFLMAARILLNKSKGLRDVPAPAERGVLGHVKYYFAGLWVGLPRWVWWMFPVTLLALLENYIIWARLPDAFFSIFCLSWFGYAVGLSLQVRRRRALAWASFVLVLSYAAGQLIYALNPVVAYTILDQSPSQSDTARWMKKNLWPNVDKVIIQDFKESDFEEPDKLVKRIIKPDANDTIARHLYNNAQSHPLKMHRQNSDRASQFILLHAFDKGRSIDWEQFTFEDKQDALKGELNKHLATPLYRQVQIDKLKLRDETRALFEDQVRADALPEQDLVMTQSQRRLNRMLLEDAFDPQIKKMAPATAFLDGAIFALLFPMKYLLFLPAFVLYLLSVVSVNSFRRALHKTTSIRKDYLSEDGILDVIGKSMDADEVKLLIRLPGVMRRYGAREERCLAVSWSATKRAGKGERKIFPITKSSLLRRVMQTEGSEIILTNEDKDEEAAELRARGTSPQTLVLIPIKFHGGVIGAVWAIFSGYGKFNDGTLEQLKFMAELVAPSVQDFRTMSAIDKFGVRLNRSKFEDLSKSQELPHALAGVGDFTAAMDELMSMLFDLLNPLCVSLLIECGFKTSRPAFPCDGPYHDILQEHRAAYGLKRAGYFETENGTVTVWEDYLPSSTGKEDQMGKLILVIPNDKDEFNKPTLAAYYLTRLMVASLVANGIINAARASLAVIIHDLGIALNKETLVYEQWFEKISAAARKAGLLWVVASGTDGSRPLLGRLEYIEIVAGLTAEEREDLQREQPGRIVHKDPASATRHIIYLKLDNTGRGLWLGVARKRFGSELNFNSPWKEFLEKLASVSKAALKSIDDRLSNEAARQREEEARLRAAKKATESEWVEKNNLIRVLTFHDLINLVRVQRDTAKAALEATSSEAEGSEDQIRNFIGTIVDSTHMTQELIRAISDLTRWDGPPYCSVAEAVQKAEQLVQYPLKQKRIKVEYDFRRGAGAKVPTVVGTLAIANLLRNAAGASPAGGTITIHTEIDNGVVSCNVLNNGEPVPDDVRKKLFRFPLTPTDEHNGWSLFVIPRLLEKIDGELQLLYSNDSGTCFTLRLPIAKD